MFSSICSRVIFRNKSDFNHVDDDTQATTWRIESQMEGTLLTKDVNKTHIKTHHKIKFKNQLELLVLLVYHFSK